MKAGSGELGADVPLKLSEHAHYVRVDDQIIVADMRSGDYLGLDGAGARVWELIGSRAARGAILKRLSSEYDVAADVLRRDVDQFLHDLLKRGLIEYDTSQSTNAA